MSTKVSEFKNYIRGLIQQELKELEEASVTGALDGGEGPPRTPYAFSGGRKKDKDKKKKITQAAGYTKVHESVNESISAFDVDFYKDTSNRQTSHKEIVRGDKFSDVISKTTKVAKSKKMNYVELYYKGAFIGSIDKRNSFKFKKGRNHQKSPLSVTENKCLCEACWKGYEKKGMKTMFGKEYPNCVKKEGIQTTTWVGLNEMYWENNIGEYGGFTFEVNEDLNEAEYQGRKVKLGKIMQGDTKKFKVYVNNPKGNVVKVNFGQGGDAKGGTMRIRKDNPGARKSFRARHNCDTPGPRHKARYWSCRKW